MKNLKLYYVAFGLCLAFLISLFNGYYYIKNEVHLQITNNKEQISRNVESLVSIWLSKRIIAIEDSVKYLEKNNIYLDENKTRKFIKNFLDKNKYFDAAQILIPNLYFYVNDIKEIDYTKKQADLHRYENLKITEIAWYRQTKQSLKTTINQIHHGLLHEQTMNICTPVKNDLDIFQGVFCGIFKISSLFEKITELNTFKNIQSFISDENGQVLTKLNNKNIKFAIETCITNKQNFMDKENNVLITVSKLEDFSWYIGTIVNLKEISKISNRKIFNHFLYIFMFFLVLFIIIILIHKIIIQKIELKNKQYEQILAHNIKMKEIGQQVSMLNHQIIMPINSISLIVSNSIDKLCKNEISKEMIMENLKLCQKSTKMLNQTISVFRNFYSQNENISKFSLKSSINAFLDIIKIEASRKNINISLNLDEDIFLFQRENFILQILMVLIQNSKTAVANSNNKTIFLNIKKSNNYILLDVVDYGIGVDFKNQKSIFNIAKSSKTSKGFGMGLYLSKKIAIEKIYGNLELKNAKNPTIFRLSILQNLKEKDERFNS